MTKKSKILYYSVLVVNIVCFILDILPFPTTFSFFRYSFSVSLLLIGLLLLVRSVTYKLDSSMFIGILFIGLGLIQLFLNIGTRYWGITINQFWPYYLFAVALSSLITGLYFKDKLQMKLFILFVGFGFFTLMYVQNVITILWLYVVLMIVWFVVYFTVNMILSKRRR